jgi:hypothetical protein
MPPTRLDSVLPAVAAAFRRASPQKRRQAARIACELAVSSAGLRDQEARAALAALAAGAAGDAHLRKALEDLAERLDDEYLRLHDLDDETRRPEADRLFSKARAASALQFALSEDDNELHESLYEAIMAVDDAAELAPSIEDALR